MVAMTVDRSMGEDDVRLLVVEQLAEGIVAHRREFGPAVDLSGEQWPRLRISQAFFASAVRIAAALSADLPRTPPSPRVR